jgi:queuosine precursor transporter
MEDQSRPNPRPAFRYYDLIMALFVTVLIVSNVASSAKIIDWGFSIFNIRMAFDGGTILVPVSYSFGDVLTEVYGFKRSRRVIWTGFVLLGLSSLVLWLIRILPGSADWQAYAGQDAYVMILGGMSSGGIALASLAGYWVGEYSNSVILAVMKVWTKGRLLWARTIGSTLVGELFDSVIFVTIATLFKVFPWSSFVSLVLTNYIFKCLVEALMTPVTYLIINKLKKSEKEDFYDIGTKFSPV